MNDAGQTITNVDIPFGRMILIILKIMLASIPALILFYLIMIPFMLIFAGGLGGCAALMSACPP